MVEVSPAFTTLELGSAYGPVYRQVSIAPPRESRPDEVPVIDLSDIYGDLSARRRLAEKVRAAAEGTGFFYIMNHGISHEVVENAREQALAFFNQPIEAKERVSKAKSKHYNGWGPHRTTHISPSESTDNREGFMWSYSPEYDPETKDPAATPEEIKPFLRGEDFVWEGTAHLPGFKEASIAYWQACLTLSRRLVKIFALSLNLPEDCFDKITTHPGSDGLYNFYPATTPEEAATTKDVGLGSHTDLQCFTILWQDMNGGLQVLNGNGEWIKVLPIADTFVVNIGDFLMRLSNDKFKSTVHRVYNRATVDRLSMPFFFGFNFNETCSVVLTCTDENNPPKYEPISCGEWCRLRFRQISLKPGQEKKRSIKAYSIPPTASPPTDRWNAPHDQDANDWLSPATGSI